jgi:hypothetical protein
MKENIADIVRDFLNNASPREIEELAAMVEGRKKKGVEGIAGMASAAAETISSQLKISDRMVKKTARNLVATLAQQYKPDLTPGELKAIVSELVPDRKKAPPLPPEMIIAMVRQFLDYSKGRMTEERLKEFPPGWQKKYWSAFPSSLQMSIAAHLKGDIGENELWERIRRGL